MEFQTYLSSPKQPGPRFGRLIWEHPSPAGPASLPFFTRTVCMAPDLLSQKCFWDLGLHKGAVKCASLLLAQLTPVPQVTHSSSFLSAFPRGALGFCRSQHFPGTGSSIYTVLESPCSSIKGKRVL